MLEVGIRVVRGPDWKWGLQDDGEGHCGTVVEIGKAGSQTSPDKTVVVQWDSGSRTNYRVGYQNAYDLLVIDNAPAGIKHPNIVCDGCKKHGIVGIRWKCESCYNYDLCTQCYMLDKHDLSHKFQRFETANSVGIEVPARNGGIKVQLKGIFVGAKVVRGPDWDWSDQDGGEGKTGRVIDIRGWDNESGKSVANVVWTSGSTNVYRLGHKGKVDLKYVEYAMGGYYYKEHLPILGVKQENIARVPGSPSHLTFNVGDKVKVLMEVSKLEQLQKGHGGWNDRIKYCIGKVGTVHRVTDKGDIRVQYEGCNNRWTFHPAALTKVNIFAVGDIVRLSDDENKVKECQKGHGDWIDAMKSSLGKVGKVNKIYRDGDLRVCIGTQTWTLNPACVTLVPGSQTELNNSMQSSSNHREEHVNPLASLLSSLKLVQPTDTTNMDKLVREAAHGHLEVVQEFLRKYPDKVNGTSNGKTCLQVACHQGHKEMVQFLLDFGANLSIADQDGDTALHYSAFGDQAEVMEILLKHGADINSVNRGRCSALHIAVNKQHVHCVRKLLLYRCNVNIQDSYGDTALHDAIGKDNVEITDLLCSYQSVDFTLKNNRGFNVLHQAALKGNNVATEKLLSRTRQLVDVKKDDGFAALHLACLNGHKIVAETLLIQGQADINLQNNRKQSSLLLAASQGRCSIVELLVSMKADIHTVDEDRESILHLVFKRGIINSEIIELESPIIYGIHTQIANLVKEQSVAVAVACYLVQEGCSLTVENSKGKTPLDLVEDPLVRDILQRYVRHQRSPDGVGQNSVTQKGGILNQQSDESQNDTPVECTVCSELADQNVLFEPCGHKIACEDCASRVKKCLKCGCLISKRIAMDGRVIPCKSRQPSAERLRYLETKIQEIEEALDCTICMERNRNVAFLCGHRTCEECSLTLKVCPMCRKTITKKINLY
ncbi:hypothetical protein RUM44_000851 [Polyplax serrata]|uniref:RING-type E3 ubiquitin transferase n=1 Tax=Polyplax serrata TaxID=468196 RepID=A0ABR1B7B6_POLSC